MEWCNAICVYMCIVVYVCELIALLKLKKKTKKHHRARVTSDFNASNVFFPIWDVRGQIVLWMCGTHLKVL